MGTKTETVRIPNQWAASFNQFFSGNVEPNWRSIPTPSYQNVTSSVQSGDAVPGFRYRIRNGENATSILIGQRRKVELTWGNFAYGGYTTPAKTTRHWNYEVGYFCTMSSGSFPSVSTTAINQAKAQFIQKCISEQSAFLSGPFVGELKESLRMIRHPAQALRRGIDDYFQALRKRRKGPLSHRRRVLADTWLEYQFGWRPLINDIKSGSEALDRIANRRLPFKMVRGYGFDSSDIPHPVNEFGPGNLRYFENYKERVDSIVKYFGVVNLDIATGPSMTAQNLGFRWDQFVPTVWELVPYSFLVDYFTNIGDVLSAWSFARSNLRWVARTTVAINSREKTAYGPRWISTPRIDSKWIIEPASARAEAKAVTRTPTVDSLIPSLELEMPGSRSLKWLNLAALVSSSRRLTPY